MVDLLAKGQGSTDGAFMCRMDSLVEQTQSSSSIFEQNVASHCCTVVHHVGVQECRNYNEQVLLVDRSRVGQQ